jgi:hypothetical protein
MTGAYSFQVMSDMNTFGYLYNGTFDPLNPDLNMMSFDDESGLNNQFRIYTDLDETKNYTLVVTTHDPDEQGLFSIIAAGVGTIIFTPLSESRECSMCHSEKMEL